MEETLAGWTPFHLLEFLRAHWDQPTPAAPVTLEPPQGGWTFDVYADGSAEAMVPRFSGKTGGYGGLRLGDVDVSLPTGTVISFTIHDPWDGTDPDVEIGTATVQSDGTLSWTLGGSPITDDPFPATIASGLTLLVGVSSSGTTTPTGDPIGFISVSPMYAVLKAALQ